MPDTVEEALTAITKKAGKSYAFDNRHDPSKPIELFFQHSDEGLVLFLVFYSRACRWSLCTGCTLPSTGSQMDVDFHSLVDQVDHVFGLEEVKSQALEIRKVIVSNQGSVLDEVTFSSLALTYLIARVKLDLPKVQSVSLETRPEYVDESELEFLARGLAEGETPTVLEIAIGFEAFDDRVRNKQFYKGMSLTQFEELVDKLAAHDFHLKCYFMQKPVVGMSDEEAIADIQAAIDYLAQISESRGIFIGMHLNPTYAARGTPLGDAFLAGEYEPPKLLDVARAALRGRGKKLHIYIGLNDEGLALEGGGFIRPGDEAVLEALEQFNRSADYSVLEGIVGVA